MPEKAIVDTSALIALEKINLLDRLCKIYNEITLPEAVLKEFGTLSLDCYVIKKVKSPLVELFVSELNLGRGESEVIALAIETKMKAIIDDQKARKIAETLMLNITGTIGILLKSEELGFIESAYNKAKELQEKGFYVSDEVLDEMLKPKKPE